MAESISVVWTYGTFGYSNNDVAVLKNLVISRCLSQFILPSEIKTATVTDNGEVKDVSLSIRSMLRAEYLRLIPALKGPYAI